MPTDGRVRIDVAIRSNELYPFAPGRTERRAVRFPRPAALRYVMGFADAPVLAALDVTHGAQEAGYRLTFLPDDDAFYAFQGYLGALRTLPGRDGPPGADYNTLPELEPWEVQLFVGYWREGNRADLDRLDRAEADGSGLLGFARAQSRVFAHNLACVRARNGCKLR